VGEHDALLRRLERNAVAACVLMAAAAWLAAPGLAAPGGVVAGGLLAAISYKGIKGGIDALVGAVGGGGSGRLRTAIGLVKFFTRYAILAVAAYVIMARLRLPPVAVVAGASSIVVAVMVEAFRPLGRKPWKNSSTNSGSSRP
jgi:hypothetical protein